MKKQEEVMKNKNIGSSFDDFLEEDGMLKEVEEAAVNKVREMKKQDEVKCKTCGYDKFDSMSYCLGCGKRYHSETEIDKAIDKAIDKFNESEQLGADYAIAPQPTDEEIMEIESLSKQDINQWNYDSCSLWCEVEDVRALENKYTTKSAKLKEQADEIERLKEELKEALKAVDLMIIDRDDYHTKNENLSSLLSEAVGMLNAIDKWFGDNDCIVGDRELSKTLKKLEQFTKVSHEQEGAN